MPAPRVSPLVQHLRERAKNIEDLLKQYKILRYGNETFRMGDRRWRNGKTGTVNVCQKCGTVYEPKKSPANCNCGGTLIARTIRVGMPPGQGGIPPKIMLSSSPKNIYREEQPVEESQEVAEQTEEDSSSSQKTDAEPDDQTASDMQTDEPGITIINPLAIALIRMEEITPQDAHRFELDVKYSLLTELGVEERYNCSVLLPWARQLAAHVTYILESRELNSAEVKAVYPELLSDLEIARSTLDHLAYLLGKQHGILSSRQFNEIMSKLLHYAEVAKGAALQLADHHEEFTTTQGSPLEGPEATFVLEEEIGTSPKLPKRNQQPSQEETQEDQ